MGAHDNLVALARGQASPPFPLIRGLVLQHSTCEGKNPVPVNAREPEKSDPVYRSKKGRSFRAEIRDKAEQREKHKP